jgi:16S rRNA (adenine1518-N6/adenine1519-N6)-dimethyltransferase
VLGPDEVREVLRRHGLDPRRSLGQNFVVDPTVVEDIAALAGVGPGDHVVEIGPGLGSLTLALHATGASVLAVEKDRTLVPVLRDVLTSRGAGEVEVVEADALVVDWDRLLEDPAEGPWKLVANLPYNVAVPLVMGVLVGAPRVQRLVVMVQREVAERLAAGPGGRVVGVPSIKVAWYAHAEVVRIVPPEVFVPRPRVDSAVISITRRPPPSTSVEPAAVFPLVERAYQQRRKMLRATLGAVLDVADFERAGVAPTARPEELDVADWAALAGG